MVKGASGSGYDMARGSPLRFELVMAHRVPWKGMSCCGTALVSVPILLSGRRGRFPVDESYAQGLICAGRSGRYEEARVLSALPEDQEGPYSSAERLGVLVIVRAGRFVMGNGRAEDATTSRLAQTGTLRNES